MENRNFVGNEVVFLGEDRVNQWPDRRDRAVPHAKKEYSREKVSRLDRYLPESRGPGRDR